MALSDAALGGIITSAIILLVAILLVLVCCLFPSLRQKLHAKCPCDRQVFCSKKPLNKVIPLESVVIDPSAPPSSGTIEDRNLVINSEDQVHKVEASDTDDDESMGLQPSKIPSQEQEDEEEIDDDVFIVSSSIEEEVSTTPQRQFPSQLNQEPLEQGTSFIIIIDQNFEVKQTNEKTESETEDICCYEDDGVENVGQAEENETVTTNNDDEILDFWSSSLQQPQINNLRIGRAKKYHKNNRYYGGIILGVDATPHRNGAYCIRQDENLCEFYSADSKLLPWRLNNVSRRGNSAEFEMKNLMFALLNWEHVITATGKLWVYTDNMAISEKGIGSRHGRNVRAYLSHLNQCNHVKIMNNKNHFVHRHKNANTFSKYILPADHLSRKKIHDFYNHIEEYFLHITTIKEGFYVSKVEKQISKWIQNECTNCKFRLKTSNSLRDAIKRRTSLAIHNVKTFPQNY